MENLTFIVYLITRLDSMGPVFKILGFLWMAVFLGLFITRYLGASTRDTVMEELYKAARNPNLSEEECLKLFGKSKAQMQALKIRSMQRFLEACYSDEVACKGYSIPLHTQLFRATPMLRHKAYTVIAGVLATLFLTMSLLMPTTRDGARILGVYGAVELVQDTRVQAFSGEIAEFVQLYFTEKMGNLSNLISNKVNEVEKAVDRATAPKGETQDSKAAKETKVAKDAKGTKPSERDAEVVVKAKEVSKVVKDVVAQTKEVAHAAKEVVDAVSQ